MRTLDFLLGSWSIHREITDRRCGTAPMFNGEASVSRLGPDEARYEERGVLTDGIGYRGRVWRVLLYRVGGLSSLTVCFSDGRPFHDLDLGRGSYEVEHRCGADCYRIGFAVPDEDTVLERWQVWGPRKDYGAATVWRRAAAGGPNRGQRLVASTGSGRRSGTVVSSCREGCDRDVRDRSRG